MSREGGFVGVDIVLFLILFFAARRPDGLKNFGAMTKLFRRQLGALGQRLNLPTPSSVSRFLSSVQHLHTRALIPWMLLKASEARDVLRHPAVATYDTQGNAWHAFDWDGTNTVLRHRALPVGPDLPEAERRSSELAKPGYTGRKRGDVKFSRATLQHAGAGLWLDIATAAGKADTAALLPSALEAIRETCRYADLPLELAFIRTDGAGGNVPWISECQKKRIHYLTRSAHYGLLDQQDIQTALASASWYPVPSSGSGPMRFAAELGEVVLRPSRTVPSAEGGEELKSIRTRMVASRFYSDEKRGAGQVRDGWQYELYANDLPPAAWSCEEVVAAYYRRGGQENRFSQEDRELGLDRIFSYHLPGQELATLVGLFVWNLRITQGFKLEQPPAEKPVQKPRNVTAVELELFPMSPAETVPAVDESATAIEPELLPGVPAQPAETVPAVDASAQVSSRPNPKLLEALEQHVDWKAILEPLPGWQRSADGLGLMCPQQTQLPLSLIPAVQGRQPRMRFLANEATCGSCPARSTCGTGGKPISTARHVTVRIDPAVSDVLPGLILEEQQRRRELRQLGRTAPKHRLKIPTPRQPTPETKPYYEWVPTPESTVGPYSVTVPLLLVAALRQSFAQACMHLRVHVELEMRPPEARPSPVIASSAAQRERRRQTWDERHLRNSLSAEARVSINFDDHDGRLEQLFAPPEPMAA